AELLGWRIAGTTLPAQDRETGATFAAEFHLDGVIVTALRTPHRSPPGQQGLGIIRAYRRRPGATRIMSAFRVASNACRLPVWVIALNRCRDSRCAGCSIEGCETT